MKTKISNNLKSIKATGGAPGTYQTLSELEQRVDALLGIAKNTSGLPNRPSFGVKDKTNPKAINTIDKYLRKPPSTSTITSATSTLIPAASANTTYPSPSLTNSLKSLSKKNFRNTPYSMSKQQSISTSLLSDIANVKNGHGMVSERFKQLFQSTSELNYTPRQLFPETNSFSNESAAGASIGDQRIGDNSESLSSVDQATNAESNDNGVGDSDGGDYESVSSLGQATNVDSVAQSFRTNEEAKLDKLLSMDANSNDTTEIETTVISLSSSSPDKDTMDDDSTSYQPPSNGRASATLAKNLRAVQVNNKETTIQRFGSQLPSTIRPATASQTTTPQRQVTNLRHGRAQQDTPHTPANTRTPQENQGTPQRRPNASEPQQRRHWGGYRNRNHFNHEIPELINNLMEDQHQVMINSNRQLQQLEQQSHLNERMANSMDVQAQSLNSIADVLRMFLQTYTNNGNQ